MSMYKTRPVTRGKRPASTASEAAPAPPSSLSTRSCRRERGQKSESRAIKSAVGHQAPRVAGECPESDADGEVGEDTELMYRRLGLSANSVRGDNIYLDQFDEFADIQMYAGMLEETPGQDPGPGVSDDTARRFVQPFAELIRPGHTRQYFSQYSSAPKELKCPNTACSANYAKAGSPLNRNLVHVSPYQLYAICGTIMDQMLHHGDELFDEIDWVAVSNASQLPVDVCKDVWWSYDITHMKDGTNGCYVDSDRRHYVETDERYFKELERRIRCLTSMAETVKSKPAKGRPKRSDSSAPRRSP